MVAILRCVEGYLIVVLVTCPSEVFFKFHVHFPLFSVDFRVFFLFYQNLSYKPIKLLGL